MAEVNVSDVMRRLKQNFNDKKKIRKDFNPKNHSIYEVCMHILNRIVDPSLPSMEIPKQKIPDTKIAPYLDRSDELQLQKLEKSRIRARIAFDEVCVGKTENAFFMYQRHAKKTNEWKIKRYAEIQEKEKRWKLVADHMAELNERRAHISRQQIEEEWQNLLDCLPEGIQKDILKNYDMPISDRAELCGGVASDSMFSRLRRQDEKDDHDKDVHWKLRHTAEEVANEFRQRVDVSYSASIRTVARNVVKKAKEEISRASVQFNTINAGLRRQMDVISSGVSAQKKEEIMQAAQYDFEREITKQMNRLAELK